MTTIRNSVTCSLFFSSFFVLPFISVYFFFQYHYTEMCNVAIVDSTALGHCVVTGAGNGQAFVG
jgi:hypothetical protein